MTEVAAAVNEFTDRLTRIGDIDQLEFRRLLAATRRLQAVNVVAANCMQSTLYCYAGDDAQADAALKNAELNGGGAEVTYRRVVNAVTRLRASDALKLAEDAFNIVSGSVFQDADLPTAIAAVGAFQLASSFLDRSSKKGVVAKMTRMTEILKPTAQTFESLGMSDSQVAAVVDEVGAVLRENNLVWLGGLPDVGCLTTEQGGPVVSFAYRVDVSPERAAELNWQLVERQVDSGLFYSGFNVMFLGQHVEGRSDVAVSA